MSIATQPTSTYGESPAQPASEPVDSFTDSGLSHQAIRAQLEKILTSPVFVRSRRLGRFLRFTIEQALEGRQATLKEYLVGVEVFNKMESFDPRIDSIVRVEARRLRSKLDHYYQTDGAEDSIIIHFLKGSYVPVIMHRDQLPASQKLSPARTQAQASIDVVPFHNLSADPADEVFCSGLAEDLISALTKLDGFRVIARPQQPAQAAVAIDVRPDYVLEGSVRRHGGRLRISAQLIDVEKGVYAWSETFDRDTTDVLAAQEELSKAIVSALVQRGA